MKFKMFDFTDWIARKCGIDNKAEKKFGIIEVISWKNTWNNKVMGTENEVYYTVIILQDLKNNYKIEMSTNNTNYAFKKGNEIIVSALNKLENNQLSLEDVYIIMSNDLLKYNTRKFRSSRNLNIPQFKELYKR